MDDEGGFGREEHLAPATVDPVLLGKLLQVSLVGVLMVEVYSGVRHLTEGTLSDVSVRQFFGAAAMPTLQVITKTVAAAEDGVAEIADALAALLQLRRVHRLLHLLVVLGVEVENVAGERHGRGEEVATDLAVDPALASTILKGERIRNYHPPNKCQQQCKPYIK